MKGTFSSRPLTESAAEGSLPACSPINLPPDFKLSIIVQELNNCPGAFVRLNAVPGQSDLTDMSTVNEKGHRTGRYLYRTLETAGGAAVLSILDLKTGNTAVYTAADFNLSPGWSRVDGIEWTAWGTLLAAAEKGTSG